MSWHRPRRPGTPTSLGALGGGIALATVALGIVVAFGGGRDRMALIAVPAAAAPAAPGTLAPRADPEPIAVEGVVVHGAAKGWYVGRPGPLHAGEPVPVVITSYCLSGTTRRGRYVRPGIIAADPRYFPLSRYVELYAGTRYLGRFLVDDTGSNIRGARIDVWLPTCRESVIFGRRRGTAVLVPRADDGVQLAGQAK